MKTITSITISDVEKRRLPSKHYVYVIFVRWSDGGQYVIYRRYSRFFDLQSTLLDKFPIEAGTIDPTQRILPILPGKILFGRSHVREVAVKRLKPIEAYCKALIKLPPSISHCEDILDFFEVDDDDLEPPRDELRKIAEPKAEKISKPKELKRLVAVEDYRQQDRGEIDLRAGQVVELVEQSHSGWWFVNAEDEQGWVPSTFLQSLKSEVDEDTFNTVSKNTGDRYMCVADYPAGREDELSLHKGDVLQVLETNMHGWWHVIYQGVHGLAPATYLTKLHDQQTLSLAEKGRVSGVEIISSLSEISELLNQTTPTAKSNRVGAEANMQNSKEEVGFEKLTSRIEVGTQRVNKTKSMERGGSLRPPPRQQSIERAAVEIGTQKAASGYSTRAEFCDPVGDGISFKANQAVKVLERAAGGWWFVQIGDQEGWAPASYIKPTPQVVETINHQQKNKYETILHTASIKPLSVNTSKHLSERKPTVQMPPERKHITLNHPKENSSETPKQFSLTDVNESCDNFVENGTTNKRSGGRAGEVGNQQITAYTPHFQTKPKPPLKPILSKPKENMSSRPGEPIVQGITASLKAKFEQSKSSRELTLTCPTSKHGTSTSKFTQSEKMARKPKLPIKPIRKTIEKNILTTLTQNEKSPQGLCEKVNVNAVVSCLSGQLGICDQQTCIMTQARTQRDGLQVYPGDARTQRDGLPVHPGDARTQRDGLQVHPSGDARTQLDGLPDHPGDATTQLDGLQVSPRGDSRTWDQLRSQVKANKRSGDHVCSESIYTSLCGFTAEQDGEVSFVKGESMTVLERLDGGWWLVSLSNGREGWVPSSFLSKS